jgi:hypothetical protein
LKKARDEFKNKLKLQLQYNKPYELREIQTSAHKFLALLKKMGGDHIQDKAVKGGYLMVGGVCLAPEYLVPGLTCWRGLARFILDKIRDWGGRPPTGADSGAFTDVFEAEYAAGQGVFELSDVIIDEGMETVNGGGS